MGNVKGDGKCDFLLVDPEKGEIKGKRDHVGSNTLSPSREIDRGPKSLLVTPTVYNATNNFNISKDENNKDEGFCYKFLQDGSQNCIGNSNY